jgi:hypothetical protein
MLMRISSPLARTTTTRSAQLLTAADSRLDGEHHAGLDGRPIVDYQGFRDPARRWGGLAG